MSRTHFAWMLACALIAGGTAWSDLGDTPLTTPVIVRLLGNMLGGALAGWGIVWLYRRFEKAR